MKKYLLIPLLTLLLAACTGLHAPAAENVHLYVLDARPAPTPATTQRDLVIAVAMPRALPGYDTAQMAYVQKAYELHYYAVNRWADTPAHMLAPLLAQALEHSGAFRTVVRTPGPVTADLRLDSEIVRLQQNFDTQPSRIELALHAQLTDLHSGRVLATRLFKASENASSENAYGGVVAANRALQRILDQLPAFCVQAVQDAK